MRLKENDAYCVEGLVDVPTLAFRQLKLLQMFNRKWLVQHLLFSLYIWQTRISQSWLYRLKFLFSISHYLFVASASLPLWQVLTAVQKADTRHL